MKTELTFKASHKSSTRREIYGFANVSKSADGQIVTDIHGDQIPPDVLESAAHSYLVKHRVAGHEHTEMGIGVVVESAFVTKEKLQAMGIESDWDGAAWWLGMRVDDPDVWASIEKGELASFSIGGVCSFEETD